MIERRALGLAQRAEPRDERRHDHLTGARAAVIAFDRDAETAVRQRAQIDALGADLHKCTRAEPLHYFRAKAAGAGDMPRMCRAGGAQPRSRLGALGRKPVARAKARKAEREMLERHRPGRHRAAVDAAALVGNRSPSDAFDSRLDFSLHWMSWLDVATRIGAEHAGQAQKSGMLARTVVVQRGGLHACTVERTH